MRSSNSESKHACHHDCSCGKQNSSALNYTDFIKIGDVSDYDINSEQLIKALTELRDDHLEEYEDLDLVKIDLNTDTPIEYIKDWIQKIINHNREIVYRVQDINSIMKLSKNLWYALIHQKFTLPNNAIKAGHYQQVELSFFHAFFEAAIDTASDAAAQLLLLNTNKNEFDKDDISFLRNAFDQCFENDMHQTLNVYIQTNIIDRNHLNIKELMERAIKTDSGMCFYTLASIDHSRKKERTLTHQDYFHFLLEAIRNQSYSIVYTLCDYCIDKNSLELNKIDAKNASLLKETFKAAYNKEIGLLLALNIPAFEFNDTEIEAMGLYQDEIVQGRAGRSIRNSLGVLLKARSIVNTYLNTKQGFDHILLNCELLIYDMGLMIQGKHPAFTKTKKCNKALADLISKLAKADNVLDKNHLDLFRSEFTFHVLKYLRDEYTKNKNFSIDEQILTALMTMLKTIKQPDPIFIQEYKLFCRMGVKSNELNKIYSVLENIISLHDATKEKRSPLLQNSKFAQKIEMPRNLFPNNNMLDLFDMKRKFLTKGISQHTVRNSSQLAL